MNCLFCSDQMDMRIIAENEFVFAIEDKYPVTIGHILIIPKRHIKDYFSMSGDERRHADQLLGELKEKIEAEDKTVTGFNIGTNCGSSAGQTVMHAHIHLIPRRNGDVDDPRGGVRGVLPLKQKY